MYIISAIFLLASLGHVGTLKLKLKSNRNYIKIETT